MGNDGEWKGVILVFRLDEVGFLFPVLSLADSFIVKGPGLGGGTSGLVEASLTCPSERKCTALDMVMVTGGPPTSQE